MDSGNITNERVVIENAGQGHMDGMTIDEEGMLWIAVFGGWSVDRYNPQTGVLLERLRLPVEQVTSVAFAGEHLDDMYITSCRYLMSEQALEEQPLAGALLKAKMDVRGVNAYEYWG